MNREQLTAVQIVVGSLKGSTKTSNIEMLTWGAAARYSNLNKYSRNKLGFKKVNRFR